MIHLENDRGDICLILSDVQGVLASSSVFSVITSGRLLHDKHDFMGLLQLPNIDIKTKTIPWLILSIVFELALAIQERIVDTRLNEILRLRISYHKSWRNV